MERRLVEQNTPVGLSDRVAALRRSSPSRVTCWSIPIGSKRGRRDARAGRDPRTGGSAVRRSRPCGTDVRGRGHQWLEPARRVVPRSGRQLSAGIGGSAEHRRRLSGKALVSIKEWDCPGPERHAHRDPGTARVLRAKRPSRHGGGGREHHGLWLVSRLSSAADVDAEAVLPLHLETEKAREDVVGERRIHVRVYTDASFDAPADGRALARRSQRSLFLRRAPSRRSSRH